MSLDDEIAGLTCRQVLAVLSDYIDGALDEPTRDQLTRHVSACANCERFGGMFGQVVAQLRATAASDESTFERLRARIAREGR
jgi:anti-sigma factor (TIGR02949 family)